jgi:hypothetical protein
MVTIGYIRFSIGKIILAKQPSSVSDVSCPSELFMLSFAAFTKLEMEFIDVYAAIVGKRLIRFYRLYTKIVNKVKKVLSAIFEHFHLLQLLRRSRRNVFKFTFEVETLSRKSTKIKRKLDAAFLARFIFRQIFNNFSGRMT